MNKRKLTVTLLGLCALILGVFALKNVFTRPGTIVLLTGTSSAGKSALFNAFLQGYGTTYQAFNFDDYEVVASQKVGRLFNDQELIALSDTFFQEICDASQQGKNSLVDISVAIPANPDDLRYAGHPAFMYGVVKQAVKILVYCPLDIIEQRVAARRATGKPEEQREAYAAFRQFPNFYKLQESDNEMVVDTVATETIKQVLQRVVDDIIRRLPPEERAEEVGIETFRKEFIKRFALDDDKKIVLVPIHPWDLVINSSVHTPTENAQIIAEYMNMHVK